MKSPKCNYRETFVAKTGHPSAYSFALPTHNCGNPNNSTSISVSVIVGWSSYDWSGTELSYQTHDSYIMQSSDKYVDTLMNDDTIYDVIPTYHQPLN